MHTIKLIFFQIILTLPKVCKKYLPNQIFKYFFSKKFPEYLI